MELATLNRHKRLRCPEGKDAEPEEAEVKTTVVFEPTVENLEKDYTHDKATGHFTCNICGKEFLRDSGYYRHHQVVKLLSSF